MPRSRFPALFAASSILMVLFHRPVFAQEAEAAAASGTIEISAPPPEERLAPQAGRTRMDEDDIAASGASSVEELIESLPGVSLSDSGGQGGQSAPSVRGSTTNSVLVIVDGAPAGDPATGLADLSRLGIDPEDIESIEVVKGGASAQWGPDASAGVVIIRTKGARGRTPSFEVEASNLSRVPFASVEGSGFDAVEVPPSGLALVDAQSLALRAVLPGGFTVSAGAERAANEYAYIDANGIDRARKNAGLVGADARASWDGTGLGGRIAARFSGSIRELGLPGTVSAPTPGDSQRDGRAQLSLSYLTDSFFSDAVTFSLAAHGLFSAIEFLPASGERATHGATRAGADASWVFAFTDAFDLGAGIAGRYERLDSSAVTDSSGEAPERFGAGAYAEPRLVLGKLALSAAGRFDWTSDYGGGPSFSLGAALECAEGLKASLVASAAYRAPSFDDLYWPAEPGAAGNPDLSPERSWGGEARVDWKREDAAASLAVFARYVRDVILWQPDGSGIWRPSNWGEALYPGAEAAASIDLGEYSLSGSWNFLRTYALSGGLSFADDVRVPMVAEHSFGARLSRGTARKGWSLGLSYEGLRYLNLANADSLPPRLAMDAEARIPLGGGASLSIKGENLFNELAESVAGYPLPGFGLRIALSWRVGGGD